MGTYSWHSARGSRSLYVLLATDVYALQDAGSQELTQELQATAPSASDNISGNAHPRSTVDRNDVLVEDRISVRSCQSNNRDAACARRTTLIERKLSPRRRVAEAILKINRRFETPSPDFFHPQALGHFYRNPNFLDAHDKEKRIQKDKNASNVRLPRQTFQDGTLNSRVDDQGGSRCRPGKCNFADTDIALLDSRRPRHKARKHRGGSR